MKKLLSILSAIGLTATASTGVVACSSAFNAGQLTINGVDDLKMYADADKGGASHTLLDDYITSRSDWRNNNAAYATQIQKAVAQNNLDDINKAAYAVVVPIFESNNVYDMDPTVLYNNLNPDNTGAHDSATKENKLTLRVFMVKLGDILNVIGTDDTNLSNLVNYDVDSTNPINNYVHINGKAAFTKEFGKDLSSENLQKILNRPGKEVSAVRVEIATAPAAVIDANVKPVRVGSTSFTLTGSNLNLLTTANTKLYDPDNNEVKIASFDAAREDYLSATVTTADPLKNGTYELKYTPEAGKTITIQIHVTTSGN